jgi:hypothetical protein
MNRRLLWLLGTALLATVAVALMGEPADDGDALLAEPAAGRARGATVPDGASAPVTRSEGPGRGTAVDAPADLGPAMHAALAAWQARLASPPQSAGRMSLAWGPAEPPPPPPPPARRVAPSEAPPPQAPRFPHQWVGRFNDEAPPDPEAEAVAPTRRVVLQGGQGVWVAREGDVIEGVWRVDRIQERALQLTYLPLAQSQSVTMR